MLTLMHIMDLNITVSAICLHPIFMNTVNMAVQISAQVLCYVLYLIIYKGLEIKFGFRVEPTGYEPAHNTG